MPTTLNGESIWLNAPSGNGVFATSAASANTGSAWIDSGSVADARSLTGADYALTFGVDASGQKTYSVTRDGQALSNDQPYTTGQAIEIDGMSFTISGSPAAGDRFDIAPSTPTQSLFDTLDKAIAALKDPSSSSSQVAQIVSGSMRDVDASLSALQSARSVAGTTPNRLDNIEKHADDRVLWAKSVRSDAEDLDMVSAISDFKSQETSYSAALQTYASVQKMTLFDYIG